MFSETLLVIETASLGFLNSGRCPLSSFREPNFIVLAATINAAATLLLRDVGLPVGPPELAE